MAIYSLCVMKYALDAECLRRYVRRRYCVGIIVNRKQKRKRTTKLFYPSSNIASTGGREKTEEGEKDMEIKNATHPLKH